MKTKKKVAAEEKSPKMYSISGSAINCTLRLIDQWRHSINNVLFFYALFIQKVGYQSFEYIFLKSKCK